MGTVTQYFTPEEASFLVAAGFPQFVNTQGSAFGVTGLSFDGAGSLPQEAAWKFTPALYGGGDVTVDIIWYGLGAASGAVTLGSGLAAITPNTDTQDPTTKTFAASPPVTTSHLGTAAKRLHKTTITLTGSQLDNMATGDEVWVRAYRMPGAGTDTLTAAIVVTSVRVSYESA